MKPPPLLLLLLVAGFVSCVPQEKREGQGAEDTLVPQSSVDSSGGSSRDLSEDADQQSVKRLPREVRADDDTQARNDLKEPNLFQQGEENISLPKALSRSLRIFRNRKTPSRSKKRSRGRYSKKRSRGRYGRRGRLRQKPKSYGAGYNNFQRDDNDYSSSKKKDIEKNDWNYGEDYDEDGSDGDFDDDDDNEEAVGDDEEEEEEEEEVYQPLRRPPESRRGNPRRGYDEEHEDMKRGYREPSNLDSDDESQRKTREKRQVGSYARVREGNDYDSDRDSSDSEDANETTPLLRSSRKKTGGKNVMKRLKDYSRKTTDTPKTKPVPRRKSYPNIRYQKLDQRDRERKDVVKRGLGSSRLKKRVKGNLRQNLGGNGNRSLGVMQKEVISELNGRFKKKKTANPSITYQGRRGSGRNDRRYDNDGHYEGGEDQRIDLRGFFSKFFNMFKKKKTTSSLNQRPSRFKGWFRRTTPRPNSYQRLRDSEEYDDDDDYYEDNEGQDIYKRMLINRAMHERKRERVTSTSSPSSLRGNGMSKALQKYESEIVVNGGSEDKDEDGRVSKYDDDDDYNEDNEGQDIYKRIFRDMYDWKRKRVTSTPSPSPLFGNTTSEALPKNKTEIDVNGGSEDKDEDGRVSRYDEGDSEDQGIGSDYNEDEGDDDEEEEDEEEKEKGKDKNYIDSSEDKGKNREYDDDGNNENEEKSQEYDDDYENEAQNIENEMQDGNNNDNEGKDEDQEYEIAEDKESKGSKAQNDGYGSVNKNSRNKGRKEDDSDEYDSKEDDSDEGYDDSNEYDD